MTARLGGDVVTPPPARDHLQTAEQGRLAASGGDHPRALRLYREAMAGARAAGAPMIVLRYYSDCVVESLELLGEHEAVLAYCDAALEGYGDQRPATDLGCRDVASLHQRRAAVLAKAKRPDEAMEAADRALQAAAWIGEELALITTLRAWLRRGLQPTVERVLAAQRLHGYFAVRPDNLDRRLLDREER